MKKFLYCAAVVALAAACTQDDDFLNNAPSSQVQKQGLTFEATLANNNVGTRGELYEDNKTYPFFWYAEQDRINIIGINLRGAVSTNGAEGSKDKWMNVGFGNNSDGKGVATQAEGAWTLPTTGEEKAYPASYKATQSQSLGRFTAASDADMLTLQTIEPDDDEKTIAGKTATIVATYGGVKASSVVSEVDPQTQEPVPGELTKLELTTVGSNINQKVDRPNQVWAPMWSVSSASRTDNYSSVGEKVNLQLIRPFPVLRFTTVGVDEFAEDFGALEKVTLITRQKGNDGKWTEAGSTIAYADGAKYTVKGEEEGWQPGWEFENSDLDYKHQVSVEIASKEKWSDANSVYMTVAPVDRSELADGEMLVVIYDFENIQFRLDGSKEGAKDYEILKSTSNWTATTSDGRPNAVTKINPLDINKYDYLVVGKGNPYTLIINNGTVAGTLNAAKTQVVWGENGVDLDDVKKIVVNCDIDDADFANLNLFTSVSDLELTEETSIPAYGLKSFANVTTLSMPEVEEINPNFLGKGAFSALENLDMASYNFPTTTINEKFFNASTKFSLKTLNISGIEDMTATWPLTRTINFDGYALTKVTVKDNVQLSPNAFANCKSLTEVDGVVTLMDNATATGAFKGATALEKISVSNTNVPASAFEGATSIEEILVDGKQIVPTIVGANAFNGATALKYMDLSKAETIGEAAFKDSGLISASKDEQILEVGVKTTNVGIFTNTSVKYVYFPNVETVGGNIFYGVESLEQVKFGQVFKVADVAAWSQPFGKNPGEVDLFLPEEMRGGDYWAIGSNSLVLPTVKDGKAGDPATVNFRVIKVDDGSFGN